MKFVNVERLEEFIEMNCKNEVDFEIVKEEVIEQAMIGNTHYEIRGYETKSGNPESIYFECDNDTITF